MTKFCDQVAHSARYPTLQLRFCGPASSVECFERSMK
jgi:hypothetical protein